MPLEFSQKVHKAFDEWVHKNVDFILGRHSSN